MSASPARVQANRANSQLSTGPRTPEGKLRSSVNALRHGLTSKMVLLPEDDLEAYNAFKRAFFDDLKPKRVLEEQLAYTLVNTRWRWNRCLAFEESILATETGGQGDPDANARLTQAQVDSLAKLSLYESRLNRMFQTTLKQFRDIQSERKALDDRAMADAAKILKHNRVKQMPFDPAEFGFVFSTAEIETWLSRAERIQAARDHDAIEFNRRFFAPSAARNITPALY